MVRVARYLTSTKEMCLCLTAPAVSKGGLDLFSTYADSSHGNGEDGVSLGGFVLLCRGRLGCGGARVGGGALAWKCEAPEEGDDSSGAAELRMVVRALKYTIAMRTIQRDLAIGIAPTAPTNLYTDAASVVSGRAGERMAKSSRWLAVRYAMVRWAEKCRTIRMGKTTSEGNCGDIMTKCLVGPAFVRHRATILGMGWPEARSEVADDAEESASAK